MFRAWYYSARVRGWAAQIILLCVIAALILWIGGNTVENLAARGIRTGFDFLFRPARFPISESVLRYDPSDNFLWAYVVGVVNTLWLSAISIALATFIGLFVALARRSANPLLSRVAGTYVTIVRNIPLIVQLLFWYSIATTTFPAPRDALTPVPGVFLTLRGVYAPTLSLEPGAGKFLGIAILGFALVLWIGLRGPRLAKMPRSVVLTVGASILVLSLLVLNSVFGQPITLELPVLTGLNFRGGMQLSPEFLAIIVGLVVYTAAFIGEIIRGGIEAVSKGQWEAAQSLGLSKQHTLHRIIFPQALRVIVPPLTTQYLSTVKNTTLAVAIGYPELGLVTNTVINQTGQAIESILIMLCVFLTVSLSVSVFMNWYNKRVALVVR